MENGEQNTLSHAGRRLLGDARLCAFLRAARMKEEELAIDLANGFLDDGMTVDFLLAAPSGGSAGFTLQAAYVGSDRARIDFALWTAHRMRSGGSWLVTFDTTDHVLALRRLTQAELEGSVRTADRA